MDAAKRICSRTMNIALTLAIPLSAILVGSFTLGQARAVDRVVKIAREAAASARG